MTDRPNPFKDIEELFDRMSRGFEPGAFGMQEIDVDVSETDTEVVVTADLPGYEKEEISITLNDNRLTLAAERTESNTEDNARYHRRERTHRQVRRTVSLPADVDEGQTSATHQNGVLTVTLQKRQTDDEGYTIDVN